jgi:Mrp family chromosome partitioning ATPase
MHQLVDELTRSGEFDLIVFDTPPVLGLADAALVAEHCDGLMLLVSLGRVDRGLPKESINRIRSSGAPLLGIVTNAIKEEREGAAAYGYGYNKYGYGQYGYKYGSSYGYGGYGYAAYDTSAAYAYYTNLEEDAGQQSRQKLKAASEVAATSAKPWQKSLDQLHELQRRFTRWLDS